MTIKDNLITCRNHYNNLLSKGKVNIVEFHTKDGEKHGIGNPDAIKAILKAAIKEIDRQIENC